jgi:hypothetical protein
VKDRNVTRDRTSATIPAKIPTETAYLERASRFAVSQDWMVETVDIELAAHHAVIETSLH